MELASKPCVTDIPFGTFANGRINDQPIEWLPSVPLTKKHKVPTISGYGILYSEELEKALHVFQTRNLAKDICENWQDQARALASDPNCRLYWLEIPEARYAE